MTAGSIGRALAGKRIFLTGGTGFLGKVLAAKLLRDVPDLAGIIVLIRPGKAGGAQARLEAEMLASPVLQSVDPTTARAKLEACEGCGTRPRFGLEEATFSALAGRVDLIVHCAGLVDFSPPLDEAVAINIDGTETVLALARAAGAPLLHTSTCYVSGCREGKVPEALALGDHPNRADTGFDGFDPEREATFCRAIIERLKLEAEDPSIVAMDLLSKGAAPLPVAEQRGPRRGSESRGAPPPAPALRAGQASSASRLSFALAAARKRAEHRAKDGLREHGKERARRYGFPNSYTYSKAIAEQLVLGARERGEISAAIVRPAILESAVEFPFPGFNQGANTTSPLIYMIHRGHRMWPTRPGVTLDILPIDMAAGAMMAIAARLAEGRAELVYQLGTSEVNPIEVLRCIELCGLYYRNKPIPGLNPFVSAAARGLLETVGVPESVYRAMSLPALARVAHVARKAGLPVGGADRMLRKAAQLVDEFIPFIAGPVVSYETRNTRALRDGLDPVDRAKMGYEPESIDWRRYWHEIHMPGIEKWTFPELEEMASRKPRAGTTGHGYGHGHGHEVSGGAQPKADATLLDLLEGAVVRAPGAPMLERLAGREVLARVAAGAARLRGLGVAAGDRVALSSESSPAWVIGYFAILATGATAIPLDATLSPRDTAHLVTLGKARLCLASAKRREVFGRHCASHPLEEICAAPASPAHPERPSTPGALRASSAQDERSDRGAIAEWKDGDVLPADVRRDPKAPASLIFTSGTTGAPKGVLLPHRAFSAQVAALASIYELAPGDRVLSILPAHHAFEFTCGLLLPLACGATIHFAAAATPEAVRAGLKRVRPTAMIAVPALLEAFLRAIRREVRAKGTAADAAFRAALAGHRKLRLATGQNLGRTLFAPAHEAFGGELRLLVSGGAALPRDAFEDYRALGFDIYEGYGLTEAGPVVAAARPGRTPRAGSVGEPIPGVEVRLGAPNADGAGEVLVRSPGVMLGYDGDPAATAAVKGGDGWLRTGDLGKLGADGTLAIVGRSKDVIVDAAGNTVYPDEIEEVYASVDGVQEIGVARLALPDGKEVPGALVLARDEAAKAAITARFAEIEKDLPFPKRLKVVRFADGPLPRTATRKVKRLELSKLLGAILERERSGETARRAGPAAAELAAAGLRAKRVVAQVAGADPSALSLETRLEDDLGLDSIARAELATAIAEETGRPAGEGTAALAGLRTVADVARVLGEKRERAGTGTGTRAGTHAGTGTTNLLDVKVPEVVKRAGNALLTWLQKRAYDGPMRAEVAGRGNIPAHANALIVSNHCSHLDVGLVKHALGDWGRRALSLGARDYFFSTPLRKLYFESFTDVMALDRQDGSRERLDQVVQRLASGENVIIFPEGTRSQNGEMGPFRPGIGYLVMKARVGVVPIWLEGTHRALPKGAAVPRSRDIGARIGRFVSYEELAKLAEGRTRHEAYRVIGERVRRAVEEAREGGGREDGAGEAAGTRAGTHAGSGSGKGTGTGTRAAAPMSPAQRVGKLLEGLPARYEAGRVSAGKTFYVKMGEGREDRYTIDLGTERCVVSAGKKEPADCVVRATPEVLEKLLRDGELPSFEDIATGSFKTNDPDALRLLVDALRLDERVAR